MRLQPISNKKRAWGIQEIRAQAKAAKREAAAAPAAPAPEVKYGATGQPRKVAPSANKPPFTMRDLGDEMLTEE